MNFQLSKLSFSGAVEKFPAITTVVTIIVFLNACAAGEPKTVEQLKAEVEQAELVLVVNRNLYVDANVRNTFFQDGYAQRKYSTDKYDPFCRFSINYETAVGVDTSQINAERMQVVSVRRARDTASTDRVRFASVGEIHAGVTQIDSWVTRLVLSSPTQPWITGLDCEIFGSRSSHLTFDDIRDTIRPSMDLVESAK